MRIPVINNQSRFQEDYADTIITGIPEDAEDGDHWLELVCDHIISGRPVYFWFIANMMQTGMQLTYHSWAHHY